MEKLSHEQLVSLSTILLEEINLRDDVIEEKEKLIKSRNDAIKENEELIKSKNDAIKENEELIKIKDDIILNNENIIRQLQELIKKGNRKLFGKSSEKVDLNQLCLFNEVENEIKTNKDLKKKKREIKKTKKLSEQVKEKVAVVEDYKINNPNCNTCNSSMREFKYDSNFIINIIPAQALITERRVYSYTCDCCNATTDKAHIIKAKGPNQVISKSVTSPSLMADIINEKYSYHMPLDRIETKYIKEIGLEISKQTMSNWLAKCDELYLSKIYDRLVEILPECDIIHSDDTPVAIVKHAEGVAGKTKKASMWVYVSGATQEKQIAIYDYRSDRKHENARNFLKDYHGYINCDGYKAYESIPNATIVGCFAHVRRYYYEALELIKPEHQADTKELIGVEFCNKLFELDESNPDELIKKRKKILWEFKEWLDSVVDTTNPNLAIGKAINYTLNQWDKLKNIALDPRLEVSNNRAERAIKPFVIGRKNWLFYFSEGGASIGARTYSIVETCKLNKLNVRKYLEYVFEEMSKENYKTEDIDKLLPTSKELPSDIYLND